jgi:thiol-disulfide isomerase/thioredoxin
MLKLKLLIFFTIVNFSIGFSQNFKVYNFKELQPILNQKDNNVYVINFWATWCRPCVNEMPVFNQVANQFKNKNVKVILVSLDFGDNVQSRVATFKKQHQIKSDIIILDDPDSNSWINKVDPKWSGSIPATLIYSKTKRKFYEKEFQFEELRNELLKFL